MADHSTPGGSAPWSRRALVLGAGALASVPVMAASMRAAHAAPPISWAGKRTDSVAKVPGKLTYAPSDTTAVQQTWIASGTSTAEFLLVPMDAASSWKLEVVDPLGKVHRGAAESQGVQRLTIPSTRNGVYAVLANLASTKNAGGEASASFGGTHTRMESWEYGFSDITDGSFMTLPSSVFRLQQAKGTNGHADGTFRPNEPLTRGEAIAFIQRAGHNSNITERWYSIRSSGFADVPAGHPLQVPVGWAKTNKITSGYADGTFRPDRVITRGEFATFLYNANPAYGDASPTLPEGRFPVTRDWVPASPTEPFTDVPSSHSMYAAIEYVRRNRATSGFTDGTFRPTRAITRGEAAQMMSGFIYD